MVKKTDEIKTIGIVGLGLIGGSFAKAAKTLTSCCVFGFDVQESVVKKAVLLDAVDGTLDAKTVKKCDVVLLALYPQAAEDFIRKHADDFAAGSIVIDCCGVKKFVCKTGFEAAKGKKWLFFGGHPMAGVERSGFAAASKGLFSRATMILVPPKGVEIETLEKLKKFFLSLGFGRIKITSAAEHDREIAYTSQLAHVLSSAYVKSPAALNHTGFSAGSFKDMTRVATLEPSLWTELFLANREALLDELNGLIERLSSYRDAIKEKDASELKKLLSEGRDMKELVEKLEKAALEKLRP